MHAQIFEAYDRICRQWSVCGDVLEVGAVAHEQTLLQLPALASAKSRTGVNLDGPHACDGFDIKKGNANAMPEFADGSFDAVLSNATLEHDPRFWLSLAEMKRVLKPGGLLVIGIPGYGAMNSLPLAGLARVLKNIPAFRRMSDAMRASAPTIGVHNYPGDYYRFSEQAVQEVFLDGCEDCDVMRVLEPPRFIGIGRKSG